MTNTVFDSFLVESNKIEGIIKFNLAEQRDLLIDFLNLKEIHLEDLCNAINIIEPRAVLRNKPGLNVRIGNHIPKKGGVYMNNLVKETLDKIKTFSPYIVHVEYESLHPFTDGNGRSGRLIWAWQMFNQYSYDLSQGFLHIFYYQALEFSRVA